MQLRVFTEPQQGASYDDLLGVARTAEEAGFDAFFRSDHFLKMGEDLSGLPGPTDAWTTLAGLARETRRIRLGTLMTSATFRLPGLLAIIVAQVDAMSGGRVELGLGTGWYGEEHEAYGVPFPPQRFGMLEEQLEIITGLWATPVGETFSYAGEHYTLSDAPALPKPTQQPRPPLLVGGKGPRRTPALAARFADEFNIAFVNLDPVRAQFDRVRAACAEARRDDMILSVAQVLCCGRTDAEVRRRAEAIGRDVDELRENGLTGSPAEVVDKLGRFAEIGTARTYLQTLDLADLDHLELVAAEVLPKVRDL